MLKCKITQLADKIWPYVVADVPVIVYGRTGVGKSTVIGNDIVRKMEEAFGEVVFHDTRLSTKDIVDGTGMPIINREEMATYWTRPAFIPADDGKMHLFLYDEVTHANVQLQHMLYAITNDRALGGYKFPARNRVILACNVREDQGGDNKLLMPLNNRIAHVTAELDAPGLIERMKQWGWDTRLVAFLTLRPAEIHNMPVEGKDPAFPSPRTLELLSNTLKALPVDTKTGVIEDVTSGLVGDGFTRQFGTFLTNLAAQLPKLPEIEANPHKAKVPEDPHFQNVVAMAIAKNVNARNAPAFSIYLARLLPDVRSMAAHCAMAENKSLKDNADLKRLILDPTAKA